MTLFEVFLFIRYGLIFCVFVVTDSAIFLGLVRNVYFLPLPPKWSWSKESERDVDQRARKQMHMNGYIPGELVCSELDFVPKLL